MLNRWTGLDRNTMATMLAAPIALGAPTSIYGGRSIRVSRGYDPDPTMVTGHRRRQGYRTRSPAVLGPRVRRVRVDERAPSHVGTRFSRGAASVQSDYVRRGPVGGRVDWASAHPHHAGLDPRKTRVRLMESPARSVIETARASTGDSMTIGSRFAGARWGPGISGWFDPVPAPSPATGRMVAPSPVGVLPESGVGQSLSWQGVQRRGQTVLSRSRPVEMPAGQGDDIVMPAPPPTMTHTDRYGSLPGYPSWQSPFGARGADYVGGGSNETGSRRFSPTAARCTVSPTCPKGLLAAAAVGATALLVLVRRRRR